MVERHPRTMYLKDLTFRGCTTWEEPVFPRLIDLLQSGRMRPIQAKPFPLADIVEVQRQFLRKHRLGMFVLTPP